MRQPTSREKIIGGLLAAVVVLSIALILVDKKNNEFLRQFPASRGFVARISDDTETIHIRVPFTGAWAGESWLYSFAITPSLAKGLVVGDSVQYTAFTRDNRKWRIATISKNEGMPPNQALQRTRAGRKSNSARR